MNIVKAGYVAAAALMYIAAPAAAQSVEYEAIEAKKIAKGKQSISPDQGYIYLHDSGRSQGVFIKTPDNEDREEFQLAWNDEFEKAQKRYVRDTKRWEYDLAEYEKSKGRVPHPGKRPVEPERASFSIGDIESRLLVSYGPYYAFEKGEDGKSLSYLIEVEPGTYTYYGPIFLAPNGQSLGKCYCMGSVQFEVSAGAITNLGNLLAGGWASDADLRQTDVLHEPNGRVPRALDYLVPASLSAYPVTQANFRAAGKVNNWYGLMVSRMPPVEGVLAYERDRIVDVKARLAMEEKAAVAPAADAPSIAAEAQTDTDAGIAVTDSN